MEKKVFVVASGSIGDGFALHGPFATMVEAQDWAEARLDQWEIIPVESVS